MWTEWNIIINTPLCRASSVFILVAVRLLHFRSLTAMNIKHNQRHSKKQQHKPFFCSIWKIRVRIRNITKQAQHNATIRSHICSHIRQQSTQHTRAHTRIEWKRQPRQQRRNKRGEKNGVQLNNIVFMKIMGARNEERLLVMLQCNL